MKPQFKSDGNGGIIISKRLMVFVMLLIAVFSCFATVVAFEVQNKADINYLKEQVSELDEFDDRIDELEKLIPVINARLKNIEINVERIYEKLET